MALSERLQALWDDLRELHQHLRADTVRKHRRINPFYEDLFDWKERGAFWVDADRGITIYNSATLVGDVEIGERTWIGPFTSLDGTGGLKIGRNCSISVGCQLVSHDSVRWALSGGAQHYEYGPISVGDCCFIGSHAFVGRGVKIGNHCLIGAGAVVTREVASFSIVAGVPARVIGKVHLGDGGTVDLEYFRGD